MNDEPNTELPMQVEPLPEITFDGNVADQAEIGQDRVNKMTQDERMAMLSKYRDIVREGKEITLTLNGNSLRILRSIRAKSIADNPRAKPAAKKAAAVGTLDLGFGVAKG